MRYLNRMGDMGETSMIPSITIFNNWQSQIPRFCFIIPTYKRADLLGFALDSCLRQNCAIDYDVLVVDDNPERDDETERLMKTFYNKPSIAYYKNSQNLKQEGNWNKLFLLARTEWMIMLHDDDMLYPDYMQYLLQLMNLYPTDVKAFFPCFIGYKFTDGLLPSRKSNTIKARCIKKPDFLQGFVVGAPVGMCVNRDAVSQIGGVIEASSVAVDFDFCARLSRVGTIVKMYGYPLGVWRIMDNVSQHKSTVLKCLEYGDVLMLDILEDLKLMKFKPIYERYLKVFDNQHLFSWYEEMGKGEPDTEDIKEVFLIDKVIYRLLRVFFILRRHLRRGGQMVKVN